MGYVSWLPDDIAILRAPTLAVRIDEWVLPSHAQADRVAEGSLDLAFAWIDTNCAETRGLTVHLAFAEPLHALRPGAAEQVSAAAVTVLVDPHTATWSSWNAYAREFAADTGARIHEIDDGGITGEAFYAHVRRSACPVLASPKRHTSAIPPTLSQSPVPTRYHYGRGRFCTAPTTIGRRCVRSSNRWAPTPTAGTGVPLRQAVGGHRPMTRIAAPSGPEKR